MKVSVIVPVYNCADYVERCVRSIMAQTHDDLEIICIDDGSVDESGNILDALALEDPRLCVVHQRNSGVSAARNTGLDIATGEFITFVDSDDALEPDMYKTLLSLFTSNDIDIVHCGYKRIRPDGEVKEVNGTGRLITQDRMDASECLLRGTLFVGSLWNKLYRAHLFRSIRMDTTLAINEDVLVNAELFMSANSIVYWDVGKYLFYERSSSATSSTKLRKKLTDCVHAADKMCALYADTPVQPAAGERLLNSQISLYRWYVMNPAEGSKQENTQLSGMIDRMIKDTGIISFRQRINYQIMRYFPGFYRYAYTVYDKVRVPDWDVKTE